MQSAEPDTKSWQLSGEIEADTYADESIALMVDIICIDVDKWKSHRRKLGHRSGLKQPLGSS